jgi:hypothetical protein
VTGCDKIIGTDELDELPCSSPESGVSFRLVMMALE